jgi:outer membrane biosynthesis protein TonB
MLEVTLSAKGEAEEVRVLRALTPLTVEAEAVLGKWQFMPATFNGHPVRPKVVLAFVFSPIYSSSSSSSHSRGRR